jgi:hypothetical protein
MDGRATRSGGRLKHDPEKCGAVFGKDHAQTSMIPKSVERFSKKIMCSNKNLEPDDDQENVIPL